MHKHFHTLSLSHTHTHAKVDETLHDAPMGSFIVRSSSRPEHFALSVVQSRGNIAHLLIIPSTKAGHTQYRLGEHGPEVFDSVEELVQYFVRHPYSYEEGTGTSLRLAEPIDEASEA
jgi:hypothetical protein